MRRRTHRRSDSLAVVGISCLLTVGGPLHPLSAQLSGFVSDPLPGRDRSATVASDSVPRLPASRSESAVVFGALAAGSAAFAAVLLADEPSREAAQEWRGKGSEEVARIGRWYGDWQRSAPYLLGGTLLIGVATRGSQGIMDAAAVVAGTLAGSMSSEVLNQAVGRRRPNQDQGQLSFEPFSGHASFPSGHTAFAFSFAGSIDAVTDGWFPAALAYGAATLTGLSRMHDDKHWLSDVVAGALIGTFVSRATAGSLRSLLAGKGAAAPRTPSVRMMAGSAYLGLELLF